MVKFTKIGSFVVLVSFLLMLIVQNVNAKVKTSLQHQTHGQNVYRHNTNKYSGIKKVPPDPQKARIHKSSNNSRYGYEYDGSHGGGGDYGISFTGIADAGHLGHRITEFVEESYPILIPSLALLGILFFIPFPTWIIPNETKESLELGWIVASKMWNEGIANVIKSDQCIERITCEITTMSRKEILVEEWIGRTLQQLPRKSPIRKRLFKGFDMSKRRHTAEPMGPNEVFAEAERTLCDRLRCEVLQSLFNLW